MTIAQTLLPEFDQEMATTRRCLERVPGDKLDFAPDPKSMKLGQLAGHLAELSGWGTITVSADELDFGANGGYKPAVFTSRQQILDLFDQNATQSRAAIAAASDAHFAKDWSLRNGPEVYFTMPRIVVLRSMVMNHIIHHRGQLSVYLRMAGAKVPSIYGPSADEQAPAAQQN